MKRKSLVCLMGIVLSISFTNSMITNKHNNFQKYAGCSYMVYSNVNDPVGKGVSMGLTSAFVGAGSTVVTLGLGPVGWTLGAVALM